MYNMGTHHLPERRDWSYSLSVFNWRICSPPLLVGRGSDPAPGTGLWSQWVLPRPGGGNPLLHKLAAPRLPLC